MHNDNPAEPLHPEPGEKDGPPDALIDRRTTQIEADGTLNIRELGIPPSNLWSPQFRDFYVRMAGHWATQSRVRVPARTAPAAEWNRFDAQIRSNYTAPLAAAIERYPVELTETQIGGVRVGTITPRNAGPRENRHRILINLRGGGFVYNSGLLFGTLESIPVASISGITTITVDYRQAPLHQYPAATEDVEAVYSGLLRQYAPGAIGIFGTSAGGTLTAQTISCFQAKGTPLPAAIGIFCNGPSPTWACKDAHWGDSGTWSSPLSPAPRRRLSERDRADLEPLQWYMESAEQNDPKAYPDCSEAVLSRFPPTLFLSGTRDFAMSTAIVAHARLLKLGVRSSLYIMEGANHAAHIVAVGTPEAHDASAYIARWFDEHLD